MPSEPGTSTRTSVLEREETVVEPQVQEPGDHERLSHYAHKDKIMEAMVMGLSLIHISEPTRPY